MDLNIDGYRLIVYYHRGLSKIHFWGLMKERPRKYPKVFYLLASVIAVLVPVVIFLTAPAQAAVEIELILSPEEGELGDEIDVEARGLEPGGYFFLYFSSDQTTSGDYIDKGVTHYKLLERNIRTSGETSLYPGEFHTVFKVPEELSDGEAVEDVHGGEYYVCVTYRTSKEIIAVATFDVAHGEIEVDPEVATVGSEVMISGQGLRPEQRIAIEYDGKGLDIEGGDTRTDGNGQFTCSIVIPEYPNGTYTITAIDESGNRPETEFGVKPQMALMPSSQGVDEVVDVSGTGFGRRERVTVTLDGVTVVTTPVTLHTTRHGSLGGSFVIPPHPAYADGAVVKVEVRDESDNVAGAELTILPIPATINLNPATSLASPGHVGMELTVSGIWFSPDATITIIYADVELLNVATTEASENRNFSVTFTVPPSRPGSHTVTARDGTNSVIATFTMEAERPVTPVLLLPAFATTTEPVTYFDWGDVTDPSGMTYVFQVGADSDFSTIVLEKRGLTDSEYILGEEEKLEPTENEAPYYWRVKAVDGTFNESDWTIPSPFYIGSPQAPIPGWLKYLWIGIGSALAVVITIRMRKRSAQ